MPRANEATSPGCAVMLAKTKADENHKLGAKLRDDVREEDLSIDSTPRWHTDG